MPALTGRPLKILFIGWANHVHFQRWVEYFASVGHRVWVLPMDSPKGSLPAGIRTLPFVTRERRTSFRITELKLYQSLLRFDLIHVHWAGFGFLPCLAGLRPYVVTAWGSDIYRMHEADEATQGLLRRSLQHAELVTVDSHDLKRAIVTLGVSPERVRVIQWGVDTALFAPRKGSGRREMLGIGSGPVIFSPRNLTPVYNTDLILASFQQVLTRHPEAVLLQKHYNCDPDTVAGYLEMASALGIADRVRLIGNLPYEELAELYGIADVVVSVPSSDATPMSVLEAMACGVIPIVSDLPSLREWIVDGENGYLVPVRDREALAARICDVLEAGTGLDGARLRNRAIIMDRAEHGQNMRAMEASYAAIMHDRSFWEARLRRHGHTGWADPAVYFYDQHLRLRAIRELLERHPAGGRRSALDYGCGVGDFCRLLARYFDRVLGFEISDQIVERARQLSAAPAIRYTAAPGDVFGGPRAEYDLILSITVLQHITDDGELQRLLGRMSAALAPGGAVVVLETCGRCEEGDGYTKRRTLDGLLRLFEGAGLQLDSNRGFYHPTECPTSTFLRYRDLRSTRWLERLVGWRIPGARTALARLASRAAERDTAYLDQSESPTRLLVFSSRAP